MSNGARTCVLDGGLADDQRFARILGVGHPLGHSGGRPRARAGSARSSAAGARHRRRRHAPPPNSSSRPSRHPTARAGAFPGGATIRTPVGEVARPARPLRQEPAGRPRSGGGRTRNSLRSKVVSIRNPRARASRSADAAEDPARRLRSHRTSGMRMFHQEHVGDGARSAELDRGRARRLASPHDPGGHPRRR